MCSVQCYYKALPFHLWCGKLISCKGNGVELSVFYWASSFHLDVRIMKLTPTWLYSAYTLYTVPHSVCSFLCVPPVHGRTKQAMIVRLWMVLLPCAWQERGGRVEIQSTQGVNVAADCTWANFCLLLNIISLSLIACSTFFNAELSFFNLPAISSVIPGSLDCG